MKSVFNGSCLTAAIVSLTSMVLMSPVASAYDIHQLGPQHFVIVCEDEDETTLSIHSNLEGAVTNAEIWCRDEGGISGGSAGGKNVIRASRELARDIEACERSGGQRVRSEVIRCPHASGTSRRSARRDASRSE